MAKILVTGGAGFIGSYVVRALVAGGHNIVVLDDLSTSKREAIPHGNQMEFIKGDVSDMATVEKAMQGCDHVIHLAAIVSIPQALDNPDKVYLTNVQGTFHVLEAARRMKLRGRVIYASSAAVYGNLSDGAVKEEDAGNVSLNNPYAASKRAGEVLARMYKDVYGLKLTTLRIFNAYGPGQDENGGYSGLLSKVVDSVTNGTLLTIYGDGSQTRDLVSVHDVAMIIRGLVQAPVTVELPWVLNVGSGIAITLLDTIRQVVSIKRVNPRVEYRPARKSDVKLSCADISLLRQIFPGWKPVDLATGLRQWLS
ncbi:MAG: SDR family NAD(P)-dependent oxidoreductase [Blastochloris viridis]|uniref:SDR family NAD(P)-dependent oxidoreductase n=1 Tax=Blastochloris viridis TaxID=1079 RepID=A0A6N4R9A1_BLAVI|nr:MAG: SDR family NAD(P)-dependent oxidoreductase [Blastochloris viridis]